MHLLHVVDTRGLPVTIGSEGRSHVDELILRQEGQARAYVEGVEARVALSGVRATGGVVRGVPALEIIAWAATHGPEIIAMTTHGRSGPARWMLGSVADKVLRTAEHPLLLYHPTLEASAVEREVEAILLPLDGTPEATAAIPMAVKLARALDRRVLVARVAPVYSLAFAMEAPHITGELLQGITEDAGQYLAGTVKRLQGEGVSAEKHLLIGDPATGILEWAGDHRGGLMVMCTHAGSGFDRAVLGSVTDKVVRSGTVPVLVVPPSGATQLTGSGSTAGNTVARVRSSRFGTPGSGSAKVEREALAKLKASGRLHAVLEEDV
jgi:nucleotide-binding universal stress UspA family protein